MTAARPSQLAVQLSFVVLIYTVAAILVRLGTGTGGHVPLFFVALFATIGWLYAAYVARRNQMEKNTYDLIQSYVKDPRFVEYRNMTMKKIGPWHRIEREEAKKILKEYYDKSNYIDKEPASFPVGHYLIQIINFYEYLAIGIDNDFLAEEPAQRYFAQTMRTFYVQKAQHIIAIIREDSRSVESTIPTRDPFGDMLARLKAWHPDLRSTELDALRPVRVRSKSPMPPG